MAYMPESGRWPNMKRINIFLLAILAIPFMSGCGNKTQIVKPIVNNNIFAVSIPEKETPVTNVTLLNVPKDSVEIGYLSYVGMEMQIEYEDQTVATIPFTEKLIPHEQLESLKTPGKKYIDFLFKNNHISFDINLVAPKTPMYHVVKFMERGNCPLKEVYVGYLEKAIYDGRSVEGYREGDYYYEFNNKWDQDLDYVYCDMVANAVYDKVDIRNYASKQTQRVNLKHESGTTYAYNVFPMIGYLNDGGGGKALFYMGEVKNVEIANGATVNHKENSYDRVSVSFENKDKIDFQDSIINMVKKVYCLGDKTETARYPLTKLIDGQELALDLTIDQSGKPKDLGTVLSSSYGNLNWKRSDGRIISHDSVMREEIKADVLSGIKDEYHEPLYIGTKEGYYRISYLANIDLLLEIDFTINSMSGADMILNARVYPCFIYGSMRPTLSYSESGEFNENYQSTLNFDVDDLRGIFNR